MQNSIALKYGNSSSDIQIRRESGAGYTAGDGAVMKITVGDQLVRDYAEQYGDRNPIHLDDRAGSESIFKSRIAHGMLSFNFFSTLLGAGFPGPGTIFTGVQEWKFTAPVKIGEELSIEISLAEARQKKSGAFDLIFDARAVKNDGTSVMSGKLAVIGPRPL